MNDPVDEDPRVTRCPVVRRADVSPDASAQDPAGHQRVRGAIRLPEIRLDHRADLAKAKTTAAISTVFDQGRDTIRARPHPQLDRETITCAGIDARRRKGP